MPYEPETYWSDRLESNFTLRGTGHLSYSPAYNEWVYRRKASALKTALRSVPEGGSALDLGSGVGWGVQQLLAHGLRVEGCDITQIAVDRLSKEIPQATFFQAAVGSAPIARDPDMFDVITLLDVAYHITDQTLWKAAVLDVGRLLRPGGVFIVTDRIAATGAQVSDHVLFRSQGDWEQATNAAGMRLRQLEPLYTWLSRPKYLRGWRAIPDGARGPIEYVLDQYRLVGREPHMRCATFTK